MVEISSTTKKGIMFFAALFAFMYTLTSTTNSQLLGYRLPIEAILSNFVIRWILLLPVTIIGGLTTTSLRATFIGFTFFQKTIAFAIVFFVYFFLLYFYFYAIVVVFVKKFHL